MYQEGSIILRMKFSYRRPSFKAQCTLDGLKIFTIFFAPFVFWQASAQNLNLSNEIHKTESVEFLSFNQPNQWGSWLQQNLPYDPARQLTAQIENIYQVKLKSRGEAHITVITPIEYWNVLKPSGLTMEDINKIAVKMKIQQAKFQVLCLGRGSAQIENNSEQTYFIVVRSQDLFNIRREVQKLFVSKGGNETQFNPSQYYPHITLGFTKRDLHESDGIIKDERSCIRNIQTGP